MSIIYDALQKTQRNREYLRLQNALIQTKPHRRNIKWMVLCSLLLTVSFGALAVYSFYVRPAVLTPMPPGESAQSAHFWITEKQKPVPVVSRLAAARPAPLPAPVPPRLSLTPPVANNMLVSGRLTLNGVLISGADKMALINKQTFHVGDLIEGMKIVSIDYNNVKLQHGAELIELRVPV